MLPSRLTSRQPRNHARRKLPIAATLAIRLRENPIHTSIGKNFPMAPR